MKTSIAIDIDDVIVNTAPLILDHYNKTYGTKIELKNLYLDTNENWGVTDMNTAIQRIHDYLDTPEYKQVPPLQQAIDVTRKLQKRYDLHLVTARIDLLQEATSQMLAESFPDVFKSVVYTNHYSDRQISKADVCRQLGAKLFIDDNLGHVLGVSAAGIDSLLFGDYPWNQTNKLPKNVQRVKDWLEIEKLLLY